MRQIGVEGTLACAPHANYADAVNTPVFALTLLFQHVKGEGAFMPCMNLINCRRDQLLVGLAEAWEIYNTQGQTEIQMAAIQRIGEDITRAEARCEIAQSISRHPTVCDVHYD